MSFVTETCELPLIACSPSWDCAVTFSRHEIYRLKKEIESRGKHLCSVVYGSPQPETGTRQLHTQNLPTEEPVQLNDIDSLDGLLALLAGTAGRYESKFPVGEVTCLDSEDLPLLHASLKAPSSTLECAGLFTTFDLMYMYSLIHPESSLHEILDHFLENAKLSENYFIANCEEI